MESTKKFMQLEIIGAKLLLGATILALLISNSPWHTFYDKIFNPIAINPTSWLVIKINLKFFINDVLMAIFFFVVGLEIKYELLEGSLNSLSKFLLPVIAALGGMIVPALIYVTLNYQHDLNLKGWAIPTATDIAFGLGVLSLLGSRVPSPLKSFLTALAIIDDLFAIMIIAIFYTEHLSFLYLALSALFLALLCWLNFKNINNLILYCLVGILLWLSMLYSGVHPTLAGVLLAFLIPLHSKENKINSPLHQAKHILHPITVLFIIPLFAFANSGITFFNISISTLNLHIIVGIFLSLFVGKQLGIFSICWLAVKLGIAQLPEKIRWIELYGVSIICGIGFTISLFIGTLAFGSLDSTILNSVKIGVFSGSFLSGIFGYLLLFYHMNRHK